MTRLKDKARLIGERIFHIGDSKSIEVVSANDGDLLFTSGDSDAHLYDISAFLGSVSLPISKSLGIGKPKYVVVEDKKGYVVVVMDEMFIIGFRCKEGLDPDVVAESGIKAIKPEDILKKKKTEEISMTKEFRLLISKVKQINLLLEEFSYGSEVRPWLDVVERKLEDFRGKKELTEYLIIEENNLSLPDMIGEINEGEVNEISKVLIDSLCRLAIQRLGPDEAKNKVHKVIQKMGFLARKKV